MKATQAFFRTLLVLLALLLAGQNAWAKLTGEIELNGYCTKSGDKYSCNLIISFDGKNAVVITNKEEPGTYIPFENEEYQIGDVMVLRINGTIQLKVSDVCQNVVPGNNLTISLKQSNTPGIWFYEAKAYKGEHSSYEVYTVSNNNDEVSISFPTSHQGIGFDRIVYKYVRNAPFSAQNTTISGINDTYINDGVNRPVPTVTYTNAKGTYPLTQGTHYNLYYSNTEGPGTATIEVDGIGEYEGSRYVQYTIRNLDPDLDFYKNTDGSYRIASKEDLAKLAQLLRIAHNTCANATFRQEGPITCDNTYEPIGTEDWAFCGTYDGGGNSISGIHVSGSNSHVGLFGNIGSGGTVKNVVLLSSSFVGSSWVGGIAGKNNGGTVQNCHVQNTVVINTSTNGSWDHGGVVGLNQGGTIAGCLCAASINNNDKTGCQEYGGIAGADNGGTIKDCLYTGSTITAASHIGAIVGNVDNMTLTNNYFTDGLLYAVNGGNQPGALRAFCITLDERVSLVGNTTAYSVSGLTAIGTTALRSGNTIYSGDHQTVTLTVPLGYSGVYSARATDGGQDITAECINGSTLTMPLYDVTVTAVISVSETLDLTAYAGTVSGVTGYWTTFYHGTLNYQLPAGAQAFTMDSGHHLVRVGTDGRIIPAGKAVVIIAEASALTGVSAGSGTLTLTRTDSSASILGTSILQGSDSPVTVSGLGGTPYVLGLVGTPAVMGFYQFTGTSIPANKAYYMVTQ